MSNQQSRIKQTKIQKTYVGHRHGVSLLCYFQVFVLLVTRTSRKDVFFSPTCSESKRGHVSQTPIFAINGGNMLPWMLIFFASRNFQFPYESTIPKYKNMSISLHIFSFIDNQFNFLLHCPRNINLSIYISFSDGLLFCVANKNTQILQLVT